MYKNPDKLHILSSIDLHLSKVKNLENPMSVLEFFMVKSVSLKMQLHEI
jgi:hypothetical protein